MAAIRWYDPSYKVVTPEGFEIDWRQYPANDDERLHASALRLLNEWVQWESVELSDADEKKARKILAAGDGAAAWKFCHAHEQVTELR